MSPNTHSLTQTGCNHRFTNNCNVIYKCRQSPNLKRPESADEHNSSVTRLFERGDSTQTVVVVLVMFLGKSKALIFHVPI